MDAKNNESYILVLGRRQKQSMDIIVSSFVFERN